LQLSPKCDFDRLQAAYERAERYGRVATAAAHMGHIPVLTHGALTTTAAEENVMFPDELLAPPVLNYSRSLRWASTAETTFLLFKRATEKARCGIPVREGVEWVKSETQRSIHPMDRPTRQSPRPACFLVEEGEVIGHLGCSRGWLSLHMLRLYYNGEQ
jgi:hypothetical protein